MLIENAIHSQQVYDPTDESIMAEQELCMERLYDYNHTRPSEHAKRAQLFERNACRGEKAYQYNLPIRIGRNCWLGAGVIVVPGVTIGDDTVIGAGSVVTKDIPANVVAVGNPCHVLRTISEHDKEYFYRDRKINWDAL